MAGEALSQDFRPGTVLERNSSSLVPLTALEREKASASRVSLKTGVSNLAEEACAVAMVQRLELTPEKEKETEKWSRRRSFEAREPEATG